MDEDSSQPKNVVRWSDRLNRACISPVTWFGIRAALVTVRVMDSAAISRASPNSISFGRPVSSIMTFDGVKFW